MNKMKNLISVVLIHCIFIMLAVFIDNSNHAILQAHASTNEKELNSTLLNSSTDTFKENPITTVVISLTNNSNSQLNSSNINASTLSSSSPSKETINQPTETGKENDTGVTNDSVISLDANSSNLQRGEYKVDDNGIHYYNIKNCSLVPGSSGIGNLSECEDAERQVREG